MPAKSQAQFKLMQAVAHNPKIAKQTGISKDVAAEFTSANTGKKAYDKLPAKMAGGGLYANIAAKKQRIASGSGEKMRAVGSSGAPTKSNFAAAAKTAYAEGGETKSTVNASGNYTKPELRKRIFNNVKAEATAGTGAGEWSARKAQVVAKRYKAAGGGYRD